MSDYVVEFDHVYKKFAMGEQHTTLRDFIAAGFGKVFRPGSRPDPSQLKKQEFWAVKDLSFNLKKGESMVDTEFQVQTYVARTTPYAPPTAVK
jgi:ABC-type polysaccharide/polyol phosphate transport system ATPase subunit